MRCKQVNKDFLDPYVQKKCSRRPRTWSTLCQELHLGVKYFRCTQYSRKVTIPKALHQCNCMLTIVGYERVNPGSDVINDALRLTLFNAAALAARGGV